MSGGRGFVGLVVLAVAASAAAFTLREPQEATGFNSVEVCDAMRRVATPTLPRDDLEWIRDASIRCARTIANELELVYLGGGRPCTGLFRVDVEPRGAEVLVRIWTGRTSPLPPECAGNHTLGGRYHTTVVSVPFNVQGRRVVDGHQGQFLGPNGPQDDPTRLDGAP